jgi:DNA-binding CsgD family transcriptional regulator
MVDSSPGDQVLVNITDEMANVGLDVPAMLTVATSTLSRLRPGTWVVTMMQDDPTWSRIVTADDSDPVMAEYIDQYVASISRPGSHQTTGLARRVIETGEPILEPGLPFDEIFALTTPAAREFFTTHPVPMDIRTAGVLVVPMRANGVTIGTIALFDWNSRLALSDADVKWMQTVADRIALDLEHAQCHGAAISRLERLTAMQHVGLAVASSHDLRLTLQVVLEQLTARLRVDAADVLLVDEGAKELYTAASFGFRTVASPDYRLPIPHDMLAAGTMTRWFDTSVDPEWARHFRRRSLFAREGFRTYRANLLMLGTRLVGVLEVFDRSVVEFDQESLGFLDAMGVHAAIAIDKAAMHERLARAGTGANQASPPPDLSRLEWQILTLLVDGASNREIADKVHLSENTIKFHVRHILDTVGATNRTDLARKATQKGWL